MKKLSIVLFAFLAICGLSSCNQPAIYPSHAVTMEKLAPYLSSNYQPGDTLYFETEAQAIDTFYILWSDVTYTVDFHEVNSHKIIEDTTWNQTSVLLTNNEISLCAAIDHTAARTTLGFKIAPADQKPKIGVSVDLDLATLPIDYTCTNSVGQTLHLRKGEGIIDFADEAGHTWSIVRNCF